jgi:hypothetical protein
MIKQRIDSIIEENNTAQSEFESLLDKLKLESRTNEINIYDSLHGTIDFSILKTKGFANVQKICFHKEGEIVEVSGLPETLKTFVCNKQLLLNLSDLPKYLEVLEIDYNYLEELDLEKNTKLKKLKCNHNNLKKIENLGENVEEIYCENNKIKRLNLQGSVKLQVLHCSNNPAIILEGVSPTIVELKNDNNPLFDNTHFCRNEGELVEKDSADLAEKEIEYTQALYQYFKIKNEYENYFLMKKREIYKKYENKNKAKQKIAKIQPKCIHCERPVGTIFELKDRYHTASCGDTRTPCKLNIKIYSGNNDYDNNIVLSLTKTQLDETKSEIIEKKMQTVLNYITEQSSSVQFKTLMEKYNMYNKEYSESLKNYEETMYGDIRKECIREKQIHIYELLEHIDGLIKEGHIEPAVKMQVKELFPEIENLRKLKYDIMEMTIIKNNSAGFSKEGSSSQNSNENNSSVIRTGENVNSNDQTEGDGNEKNENVENKPEYSLLFQNIVSPQKRYITFGNDPKVLHFII